MLVKSLVWSGILGAVLVSMASTAKADHFTHQGRLENDIERLHQSVETFYREVRFHEAFSTLSIEARALLKEVDHFCDTAQRHGSLNHLRADFRDVWREMQHVQNEFRKCWSHSHRPDRHILSVWADIERNFDRVFYDLYESHCGFIQYRCTIGNVHDHGHSHFDNHYGQYGGGYGRQDGNVQVQLGGNAPAWALLLKAALK